MALPNLQRWLEQRQALWTEILEELVRIESPSGDAAALQQCAEAVAGWIQRLLGPSQVELGSEQGCPT